MVTVNKQETAMGYVIYHKDTTKIVRVLKHGAWTTACFKTESAARAGLTRMSKKSGFDADAHAIAEQAMFRDTIEKTEVRRGVAGAHGKTFVVPVNTSWTSGPWSESYWCN
jgi:hypothetical protein